MSSKNEEQFSSISVFYDKKYVRILKLTASGPDEYSGYIYDEESQKFSQKDISSYLVRIPSISSISCCENISRHVFNLLFFALNTTREYMIGNSPDRLLTSVCIKNGEVAELGNCEESAGSEILLNVVINKIKNNEIDWGIISYFGVEEINGREAVYIELIHRDFSNIFIIPVTYSKNERIYMEIKIGETELFLSGSAV